jgi:hypothetical protein
MRLVTDSATYYEFIPFDSRGYDVDGSLLDEPEVHQLHELVEGQEYALLISTCSGTWRYTIGDTIKFTDLANLQFKITGRTKFFLNVVGSQLSEEKLNAAVQFLAETIDTPIDEYSVACLQDEDGQHYHQWLLAGDELVEDSKSYAELLDKHLKEANKNYRVARTKALKYIEVTAVTSEKWYTMLGKMKKKGGQVKTPKVVKAKKMNAILEMLRN